MKKNEDAIKKDGNGNPQLMNLFHGSGQTRPSQIYQSEDGFNINYSNEGMWGRANYFAKNSSYSNNYAYKYADGSRKMFMALVTLGKEIKMQSDKTLRQPPN
jgi:Poly(ADP-ribose) polymerase catalytic domain